MKAIVISLLSTLAYTGLSAAALQVVDYAILVPTLIQIPFVAGLIYLVLVMEGKRLENAKLREESFITITTLMLSLITDMAKQAGSQNVSFELIKSIEAYIKASIKLEKGEK